MNIQKALELIQLAKSHQCRLYTVAPDQLRWESPVMPPDELLNQLRVYKPVLMEYLKHTSRDLSVVVKRAFDGFLYCFEQVQQTRRNNSSLNLCGVSVMYWRSTVKAALQVNDAEINMIERLLIQSEQLKYMDSSNTVLITPEQQEHLHDDEIETAFNDLLNRPRQFVYC